MTMPPPPSATGNSASGDDRAEIERLLPWYVSGRLDAPDVARVEAWLARDAALAAQVVALREDSLAAGLANAAVRPPATLTVERGIALARARRRPRRFGGWRAGLVGLIEAPTAVNLRWAMAAAATAMIVVQAATIWALLPTRAPTTYQTASGGPREAADGAFVLVRFADTATAAEVAGLLQGLRMEVVAGPKPGGLFKVRIGDKTLTVPARERAIRTLRERGDIVSLATPTPE